MSGGEAFVFKAAADIAAAERKANRRRRGATDAATEHEPRSMAGLAVLIVGLGEHITAFGRRLGRLDVPAADPVGTSPGVVRSA